MSRIEWEPDDELETRSFGRINGVVVARILRIQTNDGTRYSLCYTNGMHPGYEDFKTPEEAQEAAEERIGAFLERIDADFLPDEIVQLIKDLRAAGKAIESDKLWDALLNRAMAGTYQAPAEASGPIADSGPENVTP